MTVQLWRVLSVTLGTVAVSIACGAQRAPLSVDRGDGWRGLWRPGTEAPTRWAAPDSTLLAALRWSAGRAGIQYATIPLRGDGEAWRTRAIVVRTDPARVRFRLDTAFRYARDDNGAVLRRAAWTITRAPAASILAVNAGQFSATLLGTLPWGWLVVEGREFSEPGTGPLSTAVVFDSSGAVRLMSPSAIASRDRTRGVQFAMQSFPTLLEADGVVPDALRNPDRGVDLTHRDARLAIGTRRDGVILLVLTRFDAFGPTLGAVPFGLTTPEMAALMGALGCERAVMLDGGISAQLQLRTASGGLVRWPGWRHVPLGLVVTAR